MRAQVRFDVNRASPAEIALHLIECSAAFVPPLAGRIDIAEYAAKLAERAVRFEAWDGMGVVGLVAAYDGGSNVFISNVSVAPGFRGQGIAKTLLRTCLQQMASAPRRRIQLEVNQGNAAAIRLYESMGFQIASRTGEQVYMERDGAGEAMSTGRNYDEEIEDADGHRYAYGFDFDVMHPFMLRSFEPFIRSGSVLELGSFKGDFTRRLVRRFDDVTCVEASELALEEAKKRLGDKVKFIHSRFEDATLPRRYDNIVLTHVLEHLDDPIRVLKRVNDEWLTEGGRFFLVCPNANAPSRQIAVKIGLIANNAAVTPAEAQHGHRCTYSLDTLERDAVAAGLRVVHRSGIFFKALANFQWDRLLATDIISNEYLEGCYQLGQVYPDLCSSIFLMCERGPIRT
jgi:ribosomal protein S18 acetylase RimI-like enzyme/SAM-dependent methyltransferase